MKQSAGSNNALKGGINGGNVPLTLTLSHRERGLNVPQIENSV
jgi:hypothetical protein